MLAALSSPQRAEPSLIPVLTEVAADQRDVRAHTLISRLRAAAIEQRTRKPHFGVAIACPKADNAFAAIEVRPCTGTARFNLRDKKLVRTGKPERLELGPQVAVQGGRLSVP
jgi:hypothetical protein